MTVYTLITLICLNNGVCGYAYEGNAVSKFTSYEMCATQRDQIQGQLEALASSNKNVAYISTQCLIWGSEADA